MSIRYSPRALADLCEIYEYLEPKSARGAAAVLQRIELAVKVIERIRLVGRAVKARTGVRVLPTLFEAAANIARHCVCRACRALGV